MMFRRLMTLLVGALLAASAALGDARAATHALLVGAAQYDRAEDVLQGPANDIALVWTALRERGIPAEAIQVLLDDVPPFASDLRPSGRPTRADIVAGFERLVATAQRGDEVFIMLSGHGSRQPDGADGDEADGADEIFLPVDVGQWRADQRRVENALVDDEIGAFIDRLRENGAFVWIVVDACHSGTVTRDIGGGDSQSRAVSTLSLGIPADAMPASAAPEADRPDFVDQGDVVAFFAAQSDELAIESLFPRGGGVPRDQKRMHGLLGFHLAEALMTMPSATYQDIALHILANYDRWRIQRPRPQFEGPLRRPAIGTDTAAPPTDSLRWPVRRDRDRLFLAAGYLHGVRQDSEITLSDVDGAHLDARVRIVAISAAETELAVDGATDRQLPKRMTATLDPFASPDPLRVAFADRPGWAPSPEVAARVSGILERIGAEGGLAARFVRVAPGAETDLELVFLDGSIHFKTVDQSTQLGDAVPHVQPLTVSLAGSDAQLEDALRDALGIKIKAHNIAWLFQRHRPRLEAAELKTRLFVVRQAPTTPGSTECPPKPAGRQPPPGAEEVSPASVPRLTHCDLVYFAFQNEGTAPVDTTALLIDQSDRIYKLPLLGDGLRIEAGQTVWLGPFAVVLWQHDDRGRTIAKPAGLQRLLVIGVKRPPDADPAFVVSFGFLTGTEHRRTRSLGVGDAEAQAFVDAIGGSVFPRPRTRSLAPGGGLDQGILEVIRWRTVDGGGD